MLLMKPSCDLMQAMSSLHTRTECRLGRIVELAWSKDLYTQSRHPYTEALLLAVPIPTHSSGLSAIRCKGDLPNPIRPPSSFHFQIRWLIAQKGLCDLDWPVLKVLGELHQVACHLRSSGEPPLRRPPPEPCRRRTLRPGPAQP